MALSRHNTICHVSPRRPNARANAPLLTDNAINNSSTIIKKNNP